MTTHVFIVDKNTFPIHLKYKFAGTGAGDKDEHIRLLADIKRTRPGDNVIFYLLGVGFFGIFKIAKDASVLKDPFYLIDKLKKKLIYRVFIEYDKVYPKYVTEWEALEKLPVYAQDVIWSLIYRKLKGNRGCTPITMDEADRLLDMIRRENQSRPLTTSSAEALTWDNVSQEIKVLKCEASKFEYKSTPLASLDIFSNIKKLYKRNRAYEAYLQAYFTENMGIKPNLVPICGDKNEIIWIGNEVACGVGMQKIDLFTITSDARKNKEYNVVELKDEIVTPHVVFQLLRYVDWTTSYIKGAINSNIQPIVLAPSFIKEGRKLKKWNEVREAFSEFNKENISKEIKYFEFTVNERDISFYEVTY